MLMQKEIGSENINIATNRVCIILDMKKTDLNRLVIDQCQHLP